MRELLRALTFVALMLPAAVALGCASSPTQLPHFATVGDITIGYPDGFELDDVGSDPQQTIETALDGSSRSYQEASISILNSDYTVSVAVSQLDGVRFDDELAMFERAAEGFDPALADEAGAFEQRWGLEQGYLESMASVTTVQAPERTTVAGRDAFSSETRMDLFNYATDEPAPFVSRTYCIALDDDSVALVTYGGTVDDIEANQDAIDAMLASIEIAA